MKLLEAIATQIAAPERTASQRLASLAPKVLGQAVRAIDAIASEAASITDTLTDGFIDFSLPMPDFGAINKYFEMREGEDFVVGKATPFQLEIEKMAEARNKKNINHNAQFLLYTLVEFSMALDKAIADINTNDAIPAGKKVSFPEKLEAQIESSEVALNQLIALTSAKSPHGR